MNDATRQQIVQLHASGHRFVVALAGGGSQAIADLLTVPGGSRSILEAVVPYSAAALDDWLGGEPDQYCAERTARAMAMTAFQRARSLAPHDPHRLVGIGATASLASDRPKRGPHRIHVALQTSRTTSVESIELTKGARDRDGEEQVAAVMILHTMAAAAPDSATMPEANARYTLPSEKPQRRTQTALPEWTELLLGDREMVCADMSAASGHRTATGSGDVAAAFGRRTAAGSRRHVSGTVFPGAFNPFHAGHRRMAEIAATRTGKPVWLELSIANVDKPPLDFLEIADRLGRLASLPAVLTRAPRFTEKARLFRGATFVVGVDTMERIADPRYYDGVADRVNEAIRSLADAGCTFLVFGRLIGDRFVSLSDLELPDTLRGRCEAVPEAEFREDLSSTGLRREGGSVSL